MKEAHWPIKDKARVGWSGPIPRPFGALTCIATDLTVSWERGNSSVGRRVSTEHMEGNCDFGSHALPFITPARSLFITEICSK